MNAEELKQLQLPLKTRYREDPASAVIRLSALGELEGDGIVCRVKTHEGESVAGLHPSAGGDGSAACSAEVLLQALVGCAGVTLRAVATALGIELRGGSIQAEGLMDVRGTLGVDRAAPVGITEVRLTFALETDATAEQQAKLLSLTERYCVVFQTLRQSPKISLSLT